MKRQLLLLVTILTLTSSQTLFAQITNCNAQGFDPAGQPCLNSISTAVPFLRIVPFSRAAGMGDAGIAISADANAMHFNPSKLVFAEKDLSMAATFTPWLRALGLDDVYMAYLSGYKKLDDLQAVGGSLRYFSLGTIQFTDNDGNLIGNGNPYEFELATAYSRKLTDNFAASIGAKFVFSDLASGQQVPGTGETIEPGSAFAADIGLTYQTPIDMDGLDSDLRLGLALSNIGQKITYTNSINRDFLPSNFGLGAAWELQLDNYNSFTIATDINKLMVPTPSFDPNGPDSRDQSVISGVLSSWGDAPGGGSEELRELMYSIGMEYWYDKQFAFRAGYFSEHSTKGNRKYATVGLGLKYNVFGLDLSYLVPTTSQQNPLDNTLRFTLVFDFGVLDEAGE